MTLAETAVDDPPPRLSPADIPYPLAIAYVAISLVLYLVVRANTPLTLYPEAPYDDGLFVSLGRTIAEGHWLGPFSEFTLAKGPAYPLFLAAANWLHLSVTVAHALLHSAAILLFTMVAHRFIASRLLSGILFTLMLWHPSLLDGLVARTLREQVYHATTLLFLGLAIAAFLLPARPGRAVWRAIAAGLALGYFWLMREEGIWVVPGVAVIALAGAICAFRQRRLATFGVVVAVTALVFVGTQAGFRALNWYWYGTFVGVDFKEANFQRALGAIHSVRSGGIRPLVSVTVAAREKIYAASPAFASLRPFLETPRDFAWGKITCDFQPEDCGEIGAGWFVWAFRGATAATGHYASEEVASAFYGRIASEIEAACASGVLDCVPQWQKEMPPWTWNQLRERMPPLYREALGILLLSAPPAAFLPSWGTEPRFSEGVRFLGYPDHTPSATTTAASTAYTLTGTYYRAGDDWISVSVRGPNGAPAIASVERVASPAIETRTSDLKAGLQGFAIRTACNAACVLTVTAPTGEKYERPLGEIVAPAGIDLGPGRLEFAGAEAEAGPDAVAPTLAGAVATAVRTAIVTAYRFAFVPILLIGAIGFIIATVLYFRRSLGNLAWALALAFWVLAATRISLLVLIGATAFPALTTYFLPVFFVAVAAAVFSIAAWVQVRSPRGAAA